MSAAHQRMLHVYSDPALHRFNCCLRGLGGDMKAEKQLVALLSMPLGTRDAVTVLSLDQYPPLMSLLSRRTHKDMALKVVQTVLAQVRSSVERQCVLECNRLKSRL